MRFFRKICVNKMDLVILKNIKTILKINLNNKHAEKISLQIMFCIICKLILLEKDCHKFEFKKVFPFKSKRKIFSPQKISIKISKKLRQIYYYKKSIFLIILLYLIFTQFLFFQVNLLTNLLNTFSLFV